VIVFSKMEGIGAMIQVWSVGGWFFVFVGSFDGPSVFVFVCVCVCVGGDGGCDCQLGTGMESTN
jgi:hypothetical protein